MSNKKYFYSYGKEKYGPVTIEELGSVNIKPNTLVWCEGMKNWQYAKERADLLHIFNRRHTPPPINNQNIHVLEKRYNLYKLRTMFLIFLIGGVSLMAGIYGALFNSMSETELLNVSLLWIIPMIFGISGLISLGVSSNKPIKAALITTIIITLLLFFMFNLLWSTL